MSKPMTKQPVLPTPVMNSLKDSTAVDNKLIQAMGQLKLMRIFTTLNIRKRNSFDNLNQIVYALLMIPLLQVPNIWCFTGKFLGCYINGGKDVLYDFLSRQNVNWALIQLRLSFKLWSSHMSKEANEDSAFVADDTIKRRRGKKVQAMSSHYDHNEGRSVMGQQVLQLGLTNAKGFIPLMSQIYVGSKKVVGKGRAFQDKRSAIARSSQTAYDSNKNEMLKAMLKTALSAGFHADYFIADSWFANKDNILEALNNGITPIMMMKRNKSKYRFEGNDYTLKGLYRAFRKNMIKQTDKGYSYFSLVVDYNLADKKEPPQMQKVKLIFSRVPKSPKNSWVVLLCADHLLEDNKIFDIYALRWSIECYFKEVKQYFGFLKEETGAYETPWASIHLAAMRYLLISHIYLTQNSLGFAAIRKQLGFQMEFLSFAILSWDVIRILVNQVVDHTCSFLTPEFTRTLKENIESHVTQYLHRSLQIDPESSRLRLKAEKLGLLV